MIKEIIDSIIKAIQSLYGEDYMIYKECSDMNDLKGAFYVKCTGFSGNMLSRDKYGENMEFSIQYFCKTENKNDEMYSIGEAVSEKLQYITVNNEKLKGTSIKSVLASDSISISVAYSNYVIRNTDDSDVMENMKVHVK